MDYKTTLIGRRHEQDMIREYYESPKAELVAVYGRRRVGKTYLIIHTTMVTTYGLKRNKYSDVVQREVTMDDLFRDVE